MSDCKAVANEIDLKRRQREAENIRKIKWDRLHHAMIDLEKAGQQLRLIDRTEDDHQISEAINAIDTAYGFLDSYRGQEIKAG